jgi:hypothetical protein
MDQPKKVLQTPQLKPLSANMRTEDAYVIAIGNLSVAITSLVERLEGIENRLDEIAGEAAVMSKYFERRGKKDELFTPEDGELFGDDAIGGPDELQAGTPESD